MSKTAPNHRPLHRALTVVALAACLAGATGCDDANAADGDAEATTEEPTEAPPRPAEPKKSAVAAFFEGPVPSEVKLTKSHTAYNVPYTMTIPPTWKTGGNRASNYMAMRKDSSAAVFCQGGALSVKQVNTLAKRAPARGKNVTLGGDAEKITMGGDKPFPARAGTATGTFFGEEGSKLYWMDITYEDSYGGSRMPGYAGCVLMVKAGASDEVTLEAKAILRAFRPPKGKKLLEAEEAPLFDGAKKR